MENQDTIQTGESQAVDDGSQPATPAPVPGQSNQGPVVPVSVRIVRNVITAIIALAVLVFSAYLFKIGQYGIGGTIAGVVIAHYFSGVANANTTGQIAEVMREFTSMVSTTIPK